MTQYEILRSAGDFEQNLLFNKRHERGCDVDVIFNEQRIPLHSVVLGGNSPYFELNLFSTPIVPKVITLENVNTEATKTLIKYCYSGKMEFHQKSAIDLLEVAHFLMIQDVIDDCCKIIISTLDSKNCFEVQKLAQRLRLTSLEKSAFNYIQIEFRISNDFLTMNLTQLIKILQSDVFNCAKDKYVIIIEEWINFDPEVRKKNLVDLLKHVQLEQLPLRILASQSKNLCFDKSCIDLFVEAFNKQPNMDILDSQLNESTMVVIGGSLYEKWQIVETYDTRSNNWKQSYNNIHCDFCCVFCDGKIFLFGGTKGYKFKPKNEVNCYDVKPWRIRPLAPMFDPRVDCSAVVVDEDIYVMGGTSGGPSLLSSVERYNVKANTWAQLTSMPTARFIHQAAVVNGEIFVVGGYNERDLSVNECYTISTGNWRSCKPMQEKRSAFAVAVLHGFVYAAGGLNGSNNLSTVERYDPKVDQWTFIEPLSSPRNRTALVNFCGSLVIVGGSSKEGTLDTVEKYDSLTKRWSPMSPINDARFGHNVILVPQNLLE